MSGESLPVAAFCKPAWRRRHHEHGDGNFPESRAGTETRAVPSAAASSGSMKPTAAWDGSKASLPLWCRQPELRVREGGLTYRPPSRRSPQKSQHSSSPARADSRSRCATGAGKSVPMSHSRHATCLSCSHFRVDGSGMRPNHLRCHENGILVPAPVRAVPSIKPRFDRQRHAPLFIAWMSRMSPRHTTEPALGPAHRPSVRRARSRCGQAFLSGLASGIPSSSK